MKLITFFFIYFILFSSYAQVAINTNGNAADTSAALDVDFTDRGILIPRVSLSDSSQSAPVSNPINGLLIYNTTTQADVSPGFYYWKDGKWHRISNSDETVNDAWLLDGNLNTVDGTDFIGTIDNSALNFKINSEWSGRIGVETDGSVFIGDHSGFNDNLTDNRNTLIGYYSGFDNINGEKNTALGHWALYHNVNNMNLGMGSSALFNNQGINNTIVGYYAAISNNNGSNNVANGYYSLYYNTDGNNNTALGVFSLFVNSIGNSNTSDGFYSLRYNDTGSNNTSFGYWSQYNNTSGNNNTAYGLQSLFHNTTGHDNISIGINNMLYNNQGNNNLSAGIFALYWNTNGNSNLAFGFDSLFKNDSASDNISFGSYSLYNNTSGEQNIGVGVSSLYSNDSGNYNISMGYQSMNKNTTGHHNISLGYANLYHNDDGEQNTAIGHYTMFSNTSGKYNTSLGNHALRYNETGSNNTAFGLEAFQHGSNYNNSTALGFYTDVTANNQVRIGNTDVTDIGGYANWSNLSDMRFKKSIQHNVPGLNLIMLLKPVTYRLKIDKLKKFLNHNDSQNQMINKYKSQELQVGFLAQDVELAAKKVNFDFHAVKMPKNKEDLYGLRYAEFIPVLTQAIQEQQQMLEKLQVDDLKQKKEISEIRSRIKQNN